LTCWPPILLSVRHLGCHCGDVAAAGQTRWSSSLRC